MRPDSIRNSNLIAAALESTEAEDRRQATALLGVLEVQQALPLLLRSLGDVDWRVRKEATLAARSFLEERTLVEELIRVLGPGDNVGLRNAAVDVLAAAGATATPALSVALPGLDADGRKLAVEVFGRSRDPGALEPLVLSLSDGDENVRHCAIEGIAALGAVSPDRAQAILLHALDDPDLYVRMTALEGLTAMEVAVPWSRLEPFLNDPRMRSAALPAAALGETPEAVAALVGALSEARGSSFMQALAAVARFADGPMRAHVAGALGSAGPELGAQLVAIAAAREGDPSRRADALVLAALARAEGAIDAAILGLGEESFSETAGRALRLLGLVALPVLVDRVVSAAISPETRAELVQLLGEVAQEVEPAEAPWSDLLTALRVVARDRDRRVAAAALAAVARLGTQGDFDLVVELSLSETRSVAHAAEGALARLSTRFPETARAAVERLRADGAYLPAAIMLGALSQGGSARDGDLTFLANAATAGTPAARRAAVAAVAQIGGPVAMEILSLALADEEHEVQLAAARGLGHLCVALEVGRNPRDTIPDVPISSRRPGEILQLVERSGAPDLIAATARAIGEAIATLETPPADELLYALASFARHAASTVAIAAVDALGQAPDDAPSTLALAAGLEHADDDVVRAAILRLSAREHGWETVVQALSHASSGVRLLAAEVLEGRDSPAVRAELVRRASIEPDRDVKSVLDHAISVSGRREGSR
jgi:HEAT repeat protein